MSSFLQHLQIALCARPPVWAGTTKRLQPQADFYEPIFIVVVVVVCSRQSLLVLSEVQGSDRPGRQLGEEDLDLLASRIV